MKKPTTTRRKPSKPAHHKWPVFWIRCLNGDEFISYAKVMKTGIMMMDPTVITSFGNQMVLAPYGMMSQEPGILLQHQHVIHYNEASDHMKALYEPSIEVFPFVQESFNKMIEVSVDTQVLVNQKDVEPSADAIAILEAGRAPEIEALEQATGVSTGPNPWSMDDAVEELVKLAEAAGKGKNKAK